MNVRHEQILKFASLKLHHYIKQRHNKYAKSLIQLEKWYILDGDKRLNFQKTQNYTHSTLMVVILFVF